MRLWLCSEKRKTIPSPLNTSKNAIYDCYYQYFSKFESIVRLVGYVRRFIANCQNANQKKTASLFLEEIWESEMQIVTFIQNEAIGGVTDEKLLTFCPLMDQNGIIRVKTRMIVPIP
ncbi:hypothetical protein JTB14_000085 [Gonioctena quinquepunctata]|nr:hypothetical protein JTB14_000085 [Gonioctena quinquepunctata]